MENHSNVALTANLTYQSKVILILSKVLRHWVVAFHLMFVITKMTLKFTFNTTQNISRHCMAPLHPHRHNDKVINVQALYKIHSLRLSIKCSPVLQCPENTGEQAPRTSQSERMLFSPDRQKYQQHAPKIMMMIRWERWLPSHSSFLKIWKRHAQHNTKQIQDPG